MPPCALALAVAAGGPGRLGTRDTCRAISGRPGFVSSVVLLYVRVYVTEGGLAAPCPLRHRFTLLHVRKYRGLDCQSALVVVGTRQKERSLVLVLLAVWLIVLLLLLLCL